MNDSDSCRLLAPLGELEGTSICIIDDSRAFVAGLQQLLDYHRCKVTAFTSPVTALEALPNLNPDIILTDLEMPEIGGIELTRKIRAESWGRQAPILVLTSRDDSETLAQAINSGADAFVGKTNVRSVLPAQLLALVRLRRLHRELTEAKQFAAIKALIGTYKHEFGNTLAILFGKAAKLERDLPQVLESAAYQSVKQCFTRLEDTLRKLDAVRRYEEEDYAKNGKIVKIA